MPSGEKATKSQSDKTPIVNLRGVDIFFNDKKVSVDLLNERLKGLKLDEKEPAKRVIMLESTKGTPYENYFQALAAISSHHGVVAIVEDDK